MSVTPEELIYYDEKFVAITDFTGQIYEGFLHYDPLNCQFPIQIWINDCCFITYLGIGDAESISQGTLCIAVPCVERCLPDAVTMFISETNLSCSCLSQEGYVLEWKVADQKYEFDYPEICDCHKFHAELLCSDGKWICYLALKSCDEVCADGVNVDFQLDQNLTGMGEITLASTGQCTCGLCIGSILVSFRPI